MKIHRAIVMVVLSVYLCGCSLSGPTTKIDTDGDGTPDREMTADQAIAWGKAAEKKAADDVEAKQREETAKIKRAQRKAELAVASVQNDSEAQLAQIQYQLEDAVEESRLSLAAFSQSQQQAISRIGDSVNLGLADIERKQALVSGILNSPALQAVAGSIPGGGLALGLLGTVAAGWIGRATGRKAGEDKGWDDREKHQASIDATYEEAQSRALLLMTQPPKTS